MSQIISSPSRPNHVKPFRPLRAPRHRPAGGRGFPLLPQLVLVLLLLLPTGCAPLLQSIKPIDEADRLMAQARALEKEGALQQAAAQYAAIAADYPSSRHYPAALRQAALLLIHPANPTPAPAKALKLLLTYSALPLKPEQQEQARILVALLTKIQTLAEANDRLIDQQEGLQEELTASQSRAQALEQQLAELREELEKMKEIDIQLHRSKKP